MRDTSRPGAGPAPPRLAPLAAVRRYEAIRERLPMARFPARPARARTLAEIAEGIDAFVLDGFGVLNVGARPVPGAPARMAALRAAGKRLVVLTNSATRPSRDIAAKYREMGFDFAEAEIASSRDAMAAGIEARGDALLWGFAATAGSEIEALAARATPLADAAAPYEAAEGFALLSADDWTRERQDRLIAALRAHPRPVIVGNADLVAPREDGLSIEPGFWGHEIWDETGIEPRFYGKPYANAFDLARAAIGDAIPPQRVAMVGDTLHTDILGGAAQGWRTVLVRAHGLLKDLDADALIAETGVIPDHIVETT